MTEKTFDEIIEETVVAIEKHLCDQLTPAQLAMHDDIVWLNLYLMYSEEERPKAMSGVLEALERCRKILEYGDKIISATTIKPTFLDYPLSLFGAN